VKRYRLRMVAVLKGEIWRGCFEDREDRSFERLYQKVVPGKAGT
jgi:hypothetical protein